MDNKKILLKAENLCRIDPVNKVKLVKSASCMIHQGDRIVLSGSSGSGKSVFCRMLALLDQPDQGSITFNGQLVRQADIPHYRSAVAYIRQRPVLLRGTVQENLMFPFALHINRERRFNPEKIARFLAMIDKPDTFLQKNAADLSGGERQLVCLLRVLQLDPVILLLDEPTSALDMDMAMQVELLINKWMQLHDETRAYVWISHDEQQKKRVGQQVWHMNAGVLTTGVA
ncbi:ABC transporter ATP-binding protein [Advenella faeciporci]|uniref:ABC transporter ATP-binding protein n=1 Tax=Advenella faeciporci TaxID=797535 RepID=A0A918JGQ8_9BURK|nr:ATP-binding cassette domain-containing protein [Advenella faeciporci]GGW75251.1 ABC transporter ATP-binding protein [Advenella faeciporci]